MWSPIKPSDANPSFEKKHQEGKKEMLTHAFKIMGPKPKAVIKLINGLLCSSYEIIAWRKIARDKSFCRISRCTDK